MVKITEDNFEIIASKYYRSPGDITFHEFKKDLHRLVVIQRMTTRYLSGHKLNICLVLNCVIILRNVFGDFVVPMLFFKLPRTHWSVAKSFLLYLNLLPETLVDADIRDVKADAYILQELNKL